MTPPPWSGTMDDAWPAIDSGLARALRLKSIE
jgi:hypothetical protein